MLRELIFLAINSGTMSGLQGSGKQLSLACQLFKTKKNKTTTCCVQIFIVSSNQSVVTCSRWWK
jgi:hypothetical protein